MYSASTPRVVLLIRSDMLHDQKSANRVPIGRPPDISGSSPVLRSAGISGRSITA